MQPPIDANTQLRLLLEKRCAKLARRLGKSMGPNQGFALLMFDFGDEGNLAYCSNARREDMLKAMREFIQKAEEDLI